MACETTISRRGQTAVPAEICKKYHIKAGQKIVWQDTGTSITVLPAPADPVKAFRGSSKGLLKAMYVERKKERNKERAK
jgi:bifunctional DNA-binding transcriptional regulator/antitoxin component of YhaV-PrlF toxin-antitoxin module